MIYVKQIQLILISLDLVSVWTQVHCLHNKLKFSISTLLQITCIKGTSMIKVATLQIFYITTSNLIHVYARLKHLSTNFEISIKKYFSALCQMVQSFNDYFSRRIA